MKILLADDSKMFLQSLEKELIEHGYGVKTVQNGGEAWEVFSHAPDTYDLILADNRMPVMDGLELLKRIRQNEFEVPVILMTGHDDQKATIQALRLGAFDYILKPIDIEHLDSAISKLKSLQLPRKKMEEVLPGISGEVSIEIESQIRLIEGVIAYIQTLIKPFSMSYKIDIFRMSLCLQESLVNAIVHGNLGVPSTLKEKSWEQFMAQIKEREEQPEFARKKVRVSCRFTPRYLEFTVRDEGQGFKVRELPDYRDSVALPTSGRGLLIIHAFMDDVEWSDEGRCIRMVKNFPNMRT